MQLNFCNYTEFTVCLIKTVNSFWLGENKLKKILKNRKYIIKSCFIVIHKILFVSFFFF